MCVSACAGQMILRRGEGVRCADAVLKVTMRLRNSVIARFA